VNSKQVVAAISAIVLVIILVYPAVSVGTVSVLLASTRIKKADHVYITIDSIWAHPKGQATGGAWVLISNQSLSTDLVSLENSSRFLASGQISSGNYDSIRIDVSNVTWVFNKTRTTVGVASPDIDGSVDFSVGAARTASILVTLSSQEELIASSEYFTGTMNATLTT
jgi:hypothetical protein